MYCYNFFKLIPSSIKIELHYLINPKLKFEFNFSYFLNIVICKVTNCKIVVC